MGPRPRAVTEVIDPLTVMEGAGVRLRRSIATPTLDYLDPFLLFDHFGSEDPRRLHRRLPHAPAPRHRDGHLHARRRGRPPRQHRQLGRHRRRRRAVDDRRRRHHARGDAAARATARWTASRSGSTCRRELKMTQPRYQDVAAATHPRGRRADGGARCASWPARWTACAAPVNEIYADPSTSTSRCPPGGTFEQPVAARAHRLRLRLRGRGPLRRAAELGDRGEPRCAARRRGWPSSATATSSSCRPARAAASLPARLRQAARRADRPLGAVRHEHARGGRAGAAASCATAPSCTSGRLVGTRVSRSAHHGLALVAAKGATSRMCSPTPLTAHHLIDELVAPGRRP